MRRWDCYVEGTRGEYVAYHWAWAEYIQSAAILLTVGTCRSCCSTRASEEEDERKDDDDTKDDDRDDDGYSE